MVSGKFELIRSDFCYISAFLHIVFFSGQCGFNMALLVFINGDQPPEYIVFTMWLVFEGFLIVMVSTLLLYGMYQRVHVCLLTWIFVVLICLFLYAATAINEITGLTDSNFSYFVKLHTNFFFRRVDIVGLVWRVYLLLTLSVICWLYKDIRKESLD